MPMTTQVPGASALRSLCNFLLAISLTGFSTSGQPTLCQSESIQLLKTIIQSLGNSSDATLYTPEDTIACYADNLSCFSTELQVIQKEHDDHARIVSRLQDHLERLTVRRSHTAKCLPCEAHPLHPVPVFLNRLLELLQRTCRTQRSRELVRSPPPKPKGSGSQAVSRGSPGSRGNQPGEQQNLRKPAALYNV